MFPDDNQTPYEGSNSASEPVSGVQSSEQTAGTQAGSNSWQQSSAPSGSVGNEWHGSPYGAGAGNAHQPFTVNPGPESAPYSSAGSAPFGGPNAANYGNYSGGGAGTPPTGGDPWQTVPPTPPHRPKRPKKKGKGTARMVALCLACALVGGGISGGAVALASRSSSTGNTTTSTVLQSDRTATTDVETQTVQAGSEMTVAQIYDTYVNSVVCITVSTSSSTGAGTGFIITEDGYIVTCYHVIDGATDIAVTLSDSTSYAATLVGGDEDNDVAVLKIDATGLTPVVLGDSTQLDVGDTVTTIGNALGTLANTTTTGVVSALDRAITMSDGSVINVLQTDCSINSGNSGGPLFNQYGEVVGIVNAKYSSSSSSSTASIEGIGFAIPYADVASKVTDLMEYGYITGKPSLGITVSTVSALDAQRYNMVVGAYVNSVNSGSCAETAGLQANDIITAVNGTEITTYEELVNAKNKMSAGDEMTLDVWRDGETLTITVILDEATADTDTSSSNGSDSDTQNSYGDQGNSDSQSGNSGNSMNPEDFFNYFFGNGGNSYGNNNSGSW